MATIGTNERIIELLGGAELFWSLSPEALAACGVRFRRAEFTAGTMLFARGDPGTHLYLLAEGQVRLAVATRDGRELSFAIAGPGDLFGEIAVLDQGPRSAEATALTKTVAYTLDRNDFRQLRSAYPAIADAAIAFLCRRLRDVSEKFETVALCPIEVRLARFLLNALGDQQSSAGRRLALELRFSQSELALLLGASRPKINMALGVLENAGAVRRTLDRLFCDRAKLTSVAQKDET